MLVDENRPFSSFGLSGAVLNALTRKGFELPTPIQAIALPRLLAESGHLVVKARTGTGKTAAFGIPLVEQITLWRGSPQALILTPTRELALQVSREIASFIPAGREEGERSFPRITAVYGGASIRNQILDLKRGTEIVVGTPGRIMDLMDRKILDLSAVNWFILDEADEMLDMGFFEDVETIMAALKGAPAERESETPGLPYRVALFSATMPDAILKVVRKHIGEVEILEDAAAEEGQALLIDQFYMVLKREDRLEALRRVIDGAENFYGLIFCGTKAETDELARRLVENGYPAEAIHGDLSQEARERTLRRFRSKQTTIMVATDVAARGLDIERLTHVVNWDLPHDREAYVHRIGRTGRAGRKGKAVTLALPSDRGRISQLSRSMERVLGGGILWMKVPSVKSVMKAVRARIVSDVLAGLPEIPAEIPAGIPAEILEGFSPEPSAPGDSRVPEAPVPGDSGLSGGDAGLPGTVSAASAEAAEAVQGAAGNDAAIPGAEAVQAAALVPETALIPAAAVEDLPAAGEASPFLSKVCRQLIERLGPERAVEALITVHYGELLDPSRYGTVTEFTEAQPPSPRRRPAAWEGRGSAFRREGRLPYREGPGARRESRGRNFGEDNLSETARVYVGLGRQHGASARDVAALLMRAGGVPGRLIDAIEMKDYCAFASMPEDAARRACAFSRGAPGDPPIRFAKPAK